MIEKNNTPPKSAANNEHLIWVDMEMSGLDPEKERILEIAVIVTDAHLNTIATAPVSSRGCLVRCDGCLE
jgi:oligoribonuclease